jgi:rhodanese-related sulfurtransferase
MRTLFALFCLTIASLTARAEVVDIGSAELARLMAAGVPVIDIRTAPEWKETGILPGSYPLTFFDEKGRANPAAWLARANRIAKPGEPVVLICRSGNRTREVSAFLAQRAGYAKIYNVKDGIRAWVKEGRPITPVAPTLASCRAANTC